MGAKEGRDNLGFNTTTFLLLFKPFLLFYVSHSLQSFYSPYIVLGFILMRDISTRGLASYVPCLSMLFQYQHLLMTNDQGEQRVLVSEHHNVGNQFVLGYQN